MGNTLSIAAVTAALRNRLDSVINDDSDPEFTGIAVTTRPMDQAFETPSGGDPVGNCLNIFLYHVVPSAPFRNRPAPMQVRPGESGAPPLGLTLHYMISAHGAASDDVLAHRILGKAMACLHDQPLLGANELSAFAGSDVHRQVERVRITEQPLTTEEMYKLWSAFQTHYRVSAAYEVSVVLIDSTRPIKAPLPALALQSPGGAPAPHAPDNFVVRPTLDLYPTLTAVSPPGGRDHALIGEDLTLSGNQITGASMTALHALLSHPVLPVTVRLGVTTGTDGITVTLPTTYTPPGGSALDLPAGVWTLAVEVTLDTGSTMVTNALPFVVAPEITFADVSVAYDTHGIPVLTVPVVPDVWRTQKVFLLVGSQGFPIDALTTDTASSITCPADVPPGDYYLRIRVDGVDSSIIDASAPTPGFDTDAKITIPTP